MAVFAQNAAAADLGSTVSNIASISHGPPTSRVVQDTPPASFVIQAQRTPSTVEFFRFSPLSPDAQNISINGSNFSTDGGQTFIPVGSVTGPGGTPFDFSSPLPLVSASNYFGGEVIFVSVTDAGQNGDPNTIETVTIQIVSDAGDEVLLQLFETGPDTGEFFGFIESTSNPTPIGDNVLTIVQSENLTATYQDPFDATEISSDVAGVDPFGRFFDSTTGEFVDGVEVTIVDSETGLPAQVFGIDGVSSYPSTLITGGQVSDASGLVYDFRPGEFIFPIMFPGTYRLVVTPPSGFTAPSVASQAELDALPGAPFVIIPASFLGEFILDGSGDVNFDVPLDPMSELVVTKTASTDIAAIGDFVRYEVRIENRAASSALLNVRDLLPEGFRYQAGSARRDGVTISDPLIGADGETLTFSGGILAAGEEAALTYVVEIGAGAQNGDAINRAFVATGLGRPLSNTGQANVFVREDLLRSNLTLVGRVLVDACNPDGDWPREIIATQGVPYARLYLEDGSYSTTDEDGFFHFADVSTQRHVIQLDEASLPEGYEPVVCEENTRYAGSAISQFVDVQGGSVWRANFYVRKTERAIALEAASAPDDEAVTDNLEYKTFDSAWLNKANGKAEFVYPSEGTTPSARSVHIGIKHPNLTTVTLLLNGAKVPGINFAGREVSKNLFVAVSRWRGVDLVDGDNELTAIILDQAGNEVDRVTRTVSFITEAARAEYLPEQSFLVANGRTPPRLAVRLTDGAGRPVHKGRNVSVKIDPPYAARDLQLLEDALPLTTPQSAISTTSIGADGVALIELQPTLETGAAKFSVVLDNQQEVEFTAFIKPELRDWIVVGLAEGGLSYERESGQGVPAARSLLRDGRAAVFAKGTVKGGWLVTAAVDTDEDRDNSDEAIFQDIDPDARFSVFGDRSEQGFEAESRLPVYLKVEKGGFQTTVGDYNTGLDDTQLGKYSRRLTGVQSIYEGKNFRFRGFAAETTQQFIRDEIAADGTSGPFTLTSAPLVRNSETLIVETRNRFRPDEIIATTPLVRFIDYDIEFQTGEFILRLPVAVAPDEFSFNVLVAEYETSADTTRNLVGGGRGAFRLANDRLEIGLTGIHQEGTPDDADASGDLGAVDLRVEVTDTTRLRFEYGISRNSAAPGEGDGDTTADAILAEVDHVSDRLTARAYYEETDGGYGLGQQSSAVSGIRRYGGEARLRIGEFNSERSGAQGERAVEAAVYREENLITGARRFVADVKLAHQGAFTGAAVGIRRVVEDTAEGVRRRATLLTTQAQQRFEKLGLTVRASHDQPIGSDESIQFPQRTTVGFEQTLFHVVRLDVSHQINKGDNVDSSTTIAGITAEPWTGARLTAAADYLTQDTGERLGATFGVDQQVQIDNNWSASFGVSRRQELGENGELSAVDDIVADGPVSALENNQDFTSVFIGAGFRNDNTQASSRFELRKSSDATRYAGILSAARDVSEEISFAGALRIEQSDNNDAPDERRIEARLGFAARPRDEGVIIFDRFDLRQNVVAGELTSWKAINNLGLNAQLNNRWQLSLNHGIKYSQLDTGGQSFSGFTQLVGVETRYDITDQIDIGAHVMALYSHNSRTLDYSFGPSIGINPAKNIWVSAGYNFDGFADDDFSFAEYTRRGPFVRLRIKFDQNTAAGLLDAISPGE